ncbi:MAG: FAD-dependent oxidoreductase, partial [Gammaproteobacteria bacterium]|nr:FAD-dependent oxidoreductase [Gammaproteobacteria bacterium]
MSDKVSINLNGQTVEAAAGATIREVAEANGTHIPTFCHDDRLKPFASCFLCIVEVEGARTLLPACSTRVAPNMVIKTDSETVTRTRKQALNLLLSDHAGDCIAPCEVTCPANIDIQGYIAHIANGDFEAAVHLIKQRNPLPVVCGRICPHPCESQCRRALVDEAMAINPLKRFAADYELSNGAVVPGAGPDTGKRVAIVGGGPAGLSAAFFLRQIGHGVEIFEALPELGGMARYGIPRFRLPWDMMDGEIKAIIDLGVQVHHNQRLGRDFTIDDLKQQGFGAVLLAIGAHKAKPMRVKNEDMPGVIGGVDFLRKAVLGEETGAGPGKTIAVIGGGDTAMDCARVAKRLGSEDVALLYRRTQAEMPALPLEQEETIEEGVDVRFLTAPSEVIVENGLATGLRVITMELGEPDDSGRRRPVPIEDSDEDLPFDLIIAAIGQDPDMSCIANEKVKPDTTRWNTFIYDVKTAVTSVDGVFAAGDCSFGPDILIRAVGEGRRAARAMDLYLKGSEITLKEEYEHSRGRLEDLEMADFSPRFVHKKRALESTLPADQRLSNNGGWAPINVGLDDAKAMAEASRCIECGCNARFDCDLRNYATDYRADDKLMAGAKRAYDEDGRHPLIRIESDKCITCASCVRICSEVRGINALAFINRGFTTRIGPNFNDPLQQTGCDACGMCIDVCPTGAMAHNTGKESGPWLSEQTITTCTACSRGCGLTALNNRDRIVKIGSIDGDPVNGAVICAEGRFSYQLLGKSTTTTGTEEQAKELLAASKRVAVVVSPRLTIEQTYAAARLAREHNGNLHYTAATEIRGATSAAGKIHGEANVALLKRLGATPWKTPNPSDCVLLVGISMDCSDVDA